jgi:hypothetical protein
MSTPQERAAERARWPIRRIELADEGADDDLSLRTSAIERLEMMETLARDSFGESPRVVRAELPGRVIRNAW